MSEEPFRLADNGHLRITLTTPLFVDDGPYMVIRWSELDRDQVRFYRWKRSNPFEHIAEWCYTIAFGYLNSNSSGVRRALASLERTSAIITD